MWDEIFALERKKQVKNEMKFERHSKEYIDYLKSSTWRDRCKKLKKERGNKCEECHADNVSLEVHHMNYDRIGRELDSDLKVLCKECHKHADKNRMRM